MSNSNKIWGSGWKNQMVSLIHVGILVSMIVLIWTSISISQRIQELKTDSATLNHIENGMLNVEAWKYRIADILLKKVDEFELNGTNRAQIKEMVEQGLRTAISKIRSIIDDKKENSRFSRFLIGIVEKYAIKIDDFEQEIPDIAEGIMKDLDNPQNRAEIKTVLKEQLMKYLNETEGIENPVFEKVILRYEADSLEAANSIIFTELDPLAENLQLRIWLLLLLFVGMTVFCFLRAHKVDIYLFIGGVIILLIGGVALPMIDIDARIESFNFVVLGEPISFQNQVLFFQSKSILDVIQLLIENRRFDSVLVGCLVMLFSLLFPLLKIAFSLIHLQSDSWSKSWVAKFFVFKSAKWSMADVFVVAIFMAYVGFKSILKSQLQPLNFSENQLQMLTTDKTCFQEGFLVFLCFALAGIFVSVLIERSSKRERKRNESLASSTA